jgi:hypothetical protein
MIKLFALIQDIVYGTYVSAGAVCVAPFQLYLMGLAKLKDVDAEFYSPSGSIYDSETKKQIISNNFFYGNMSNLSKLPESVLYLGPAAVLPYSTTAILATITMPFTIDDYNTRTATSKYD